MSQWAVHTNSPSETQYGWLRLRPLDNQRNNEYKVDTMDKTDGRGTPLFVTKKPKKWPFRISILALFILGMISGVYWIGFICLGLEFLLDVAY